MHRITLLLFGGAAEMDSDIRRPRDEFALTAVGPFASFVLAATFGLTATYAAQAGIEIIAEVAGLLGWVNLALGVFKLLPGAPLDGGRILRSPVWAATGDRQRATRVAAATSAAAAHAVVCERGDSNPQGPVSPLGPKPSASASSATLAWVGNLPLTGHNARTARAGCGQIPVTRGRFLA